MLGSSSYPESDKEAGGSVSFVNLRTNREALLRVRPAFLLGCFAFLIAIILPDIIRRIPALQQALLVVAALAVGSGWLLLLRHSEQGSRWRSWLSFVTATYLTASIPAVFFELRPWWLFHPAASLYVRPWAHWSYSIMCLSILGSFSTRGRVRVALVVGSVALIILRASMFTWLL
jgi:hypothetical protein